MAKCKLFGRRIEPACKYCSHGFLTGDEQLVLCTETGVVAPYHSCPSFEYDPLKRIPQRPRQLEKLDPKEFSL